MTTDAQRGSGAWPNLDVAKECSASSDSCWLCDRLAEWNVALGNFPIRLTESSPGKICLTVDVTAPGTDHQSSCFLQETAAKTVWLLKKHRCIETLRIGRLTERDRMSIMLGQTISFADVAVGDEVAMLTTNVRHIFIGEQVPDKWDFLLDAIGPMKKLESLTVEYIHASSTSAEKLAELLAASADTVRKVYVKGFERDYRDVEATLHAFESWQSMEDTLCSDVLMDGIAKCRNLTELVYHGDLGTKGLKSLDGLLRSNNTLQKFWLAPEKKVQIAFCEFMGENTTLTELELFAKESDEGVINKVLSAVENHGILERLTIHGGLQKSNQLQLKSLISKNRSIRSLTIREDIIYFSFGKLIAEGLSENETLDCLDLSGCEVDFRSVLALFDALTRNTCSVKFGFLGPLPGSSPLCEDSWTYQPTMKENRPELAEKLRTNNLYGRVQLEWSDYDASGLAVSLHFRPMDLELDTYKLAKEKFDSVCNALSSSLLVRSLTVRLSRGKSEYVESLCEALKQNVSLKRVTLIEDWESAGLAARVAQGLRSNMAVTHLEIECHEMSPQGAEDLRNVIAENIYLNGIDLTVIRRVSRECIDILSRGVVQNPFITSFNTSEVHKDADMTEINVAVMGNSVCLNRAVRFVLGRNTGMLCAEAFKLFQGQSSLIGRVKEASGKSNEEARVAINLASHKVGGVIAAGKVGTCGVNHKVRFITCATGVVYEVPLTCDHVYIGETGRCVNQRLKEHQQSPRERVNSRGEKVSLTWYAHTEHCTVPDCEPKFHKTKILAKHIDKMTRQMIEAYNIKKNGEQCISQPSISLSKTKVQCRGGQL